MAEGRGQYVTGCTKCDELLDQMRKHQVLKRGELCTKQFVSMFVFPSACQTKRRFYLQEVSCYTLLKKLKGSKTKEMNVFGGVQFGSPLTHIYNVLGRILLQSLNSGYKNSGRKTFYLLMRFFIDVFPSLQAAIHSSYNTNIKTGIAEFELTFPW